MITQTLCKMVILSLLSLPTLAASEAANIHKNINTEISAAKGESAYKENCAGCHDAKGSKAPSLEAIKLKPADFIVNALTRGKMRVQGVSLGVHKLASVVMWLTQDQPKPVNWVNTFSCKDKTVNLTTGPKLGDWGYGAKNHRYQTPELGGINSKNVGKLKLKWAMAFPYASEMRSQPALIGDTLFIGLSDINKVYALDADTGCVKWEYTSLLGPRTAMGYADINGKPTLWFGDIGSNVYALDPLTGKEIWVKNIAIHSQSAITGPAVLNDNILYVPMSLYEVASAGLATYECCTGHGGIVAINAATGEKLWQFDTTIAPQKTQLSSNGTQQWGPSGAPVWNSPAIDVKRGLLYFGTGENTSDPATDTSDAIFALDLKTGKKKWHFQATKNDTFNIACGRIKGPNCPKVAGPDFDFGASVIIATLPNGKDILYAGQKSGTVWALDPDDNGRVIWEQNQLSQGTPFGGIHWGIAYDGERLLVPIADPHLPKPNYNAKPALHALDQETGEILWTQNIEPSCEFNRQKAMASMAAGKPLDCHPWRGISAPPTIVDDVVLVGNIEGMYRAYHTKTGKLLWQRNTNIAFDGINGVAGHGGSIDNNGSLISAGRVYIQSGYSLFRQLPGNVLLQYTLEGK
jgi:polyvinyl alcohol dehydrogenase (cytochrome)